MAANPPTGLATMPYPKDSKAPYFSGRPGDLLDSFLQEFEELANQSALTAQQKLETILRYIPPTLQDLWKIFEGYLACFPMILGEDVPQHISTSEVFKTKALRIHRLQQQNLDVWRRRCSSILQGFSRLRPAVNRV